MKIVIIEDEDLSSSDLSDTIMRVEKNAEILAILKSVKEATHYFNNPPQKPDIVFSDIQLGDGLSFEIFKNVNCDFPIIFCTAYDEYALEALKTHGIFYILKPFTDKTIIDAFEKYKFLQQTLIPQSSYGDISTQISVQKQRKLGSVLVYFKERILPIKLSQIALFFLESNNLYIYTFSNQQYKLNMTLEEAEVLSGELFFKANRQCLIHRDAILEASQYFGRKLLVSLKVKYAEPIIISKEKAPAFLHWLTAD